jgi:hypothetical protein
LLLIILSTGTILYSGAARRLPMMTAVKTLARSWRGSFSVCVLSDLFRSLPVVATRVDRKKENRFLTHSGSYKYQIPTSAYATNIFHNPWLPYIPCPLRWWLVDTCHKERGGAITRILRTATWYRLKHNSNSNSNNRNNVSSRLWYYTSCPPHLRTRIFLEELWMSCPHLPLYIHCYPKEPTTRGKFNCHRCQCATCDKYPSFHIAHPPGQAENPCLGNDQLLKTHRPCQELLWLLTNQNGIYR